MSTSHEPVRFYSVEIDKTDRHWVLTHWMEHAMLRLRIAHGQLADFDSADRIIFEVKLSEATTFHTLSEASVVSYEFLPDSFLGSPGNRLCGCGEGFPWPFRTEFVQMVGCWAQLRMVCQFRPTMEEEEAPRSAWIRR